MPTVTVGIPVFNGENYLQEAIESILNQTFQDIELIISDNASTDRTEEICRHYVTKDNRVRYVKNENNRGAAYNFNRVFQLASSKSYFLWAAHDDIYAPEFLSKCVQILDDDPSVVLCFSKTKFIDEQGNFLQDYNYWPEANSPSACRRFFQLAIGNYVVVEIFGLIRTNILKKTRLIGDFAASDRVLLSELSLYGRFFEIPEPLFFHREHAQRSGKIYRNLMAYEAWFAPAKAQKIGYPTWKLFFEQLAVIKRTHLHYSEKLKCYLQMIRWLRVKRDHMLNDLIYAYKAKKY